jgi:tetratricopeptide (TPR) repeat protein
MLRVALVAAVALSAVGAASAQAGTQVVGSSNALRCMDAAFAGSSARTALDLCSTALAEDALTPANRAGTLINRGVLHMNRRDFPAALADFETALQITPRSGEAFFNRGSVRVAQGQFQEGVADIDRGLELGMGQPEKAYYNRALARESLADTRGAYLDYRQAARLKPGWTLPQRELARFNVQRR